MRVISTDGLKSRIINYAGKIACENMALSKQGKTDNGINEALIELMFIHEALPHWSTKQIRQKECYLNEKYGI